MLNKNEIQAGDESTNIQHSQNVTVTNTQNYGVSYSDVKEIAMDVFKGNFYQLAKDAADIARDRAEELTDKFLKNLEETRPQATQQMKNPDMQYALFIAQREYARTGDRDLLDILVNVLVDRIELEERSLMQIVLNESLEVIPKLTNSQLDILSLVFLLRYTKRTNLRNIEDLKKYILNTVVPFMNVPEGNSYYQHLEFTGCGSISVLDIKIESVYQENYQGLFSKGFTKEEFDRVLKNEVLSKPILLPCLHNKDLFQVSTLDDNQLKEFCLNAGASVELVEGIKQLQNSKIMTIEEIKDVCISLDPSINQLFNIWENTSLNMLTLTSVGIAIAYANIQRKIDDKYDLSIWI